MKTFKEYVNVSASRYAINSISPGKGAWEVRKGTNKTKQYMVYTGKQLKFENSHGKTIKVINVESEQEALDYIKKEKYEKWD